MSNLFEKPASFDDDKIRINVMCIKKEIPEDVCRAYTNAKITMDLPTMIAIHEKYAHKSTEPEDTEHKKPFRTPEQYKATTVFKKLQRTLKYKVFKEEVLLDHNHSCDCCEREFPTREQWKVENPTDTYPLMVRCTFPIMKYITIHQIFDVRTLIAQPKMWDMKYYSVLCTDCKAPAFGSRKSE